jgi:hypothetical protein
MRRLSLIAFAALSVSGCSTIYDSQYQHVTVATPGAVGAECIIDTPKNKYRVITPGKVMLMRDNETLMIDCHKAQFKDAHKSVESAMTLNDHTWLNVFNGVVPGTSYDIAADSIYAWPHVIEIPMEPDADMINAVSDLKSETPVPPPEKRVIEAPVPPFIAPPVTTPADSTVNRAMGK